MMGKSPGKWIKTLLFGKKSFKSRASKGRASAANSKDWRGCEGGTDLAAHSPVISEPVPVNANQIGTNMELEKEAPSKLDCGGDVILPEQPEDQLTTVSNVSNDPERAREEEAAIKVQAAFRGYLARRAFRALKGIIKLQALIRGHLVRRQAIATLHCMWGIVKIQALMRSRRVRHDNDFEEARHANPFRTNLLSWKGKASVNAFVCKLLSLSTVAKRLEIRYHLEESNSVWSWLERWTTSRFWKLPPQQKKAVDSKPQRRHYAMETESGRPKRSMRRNFGTNTESVSNSTMTSESEKPRRNVKKISSHPADPVQESPQSELEKVKHNLRKISSSMGESSDRFGVEIEKPKCIGQKVSNSASDVVDQVAEDPSGEMNKDVANLVPELTQSVEISLKLGVLENTSSPTDILAEDHVDSTEDMKDAKLVPDSSQNVEITSLPVVTDGPTPRDGEDHTAAELLPPENGGKEENICVVNMELNSEEQASQENHKASKRRASFLAKSDSTENGLQHSPMLPSYMAATKSAKAKVRGQNSPRFSSDGIDKSTFTRRHSLPSSTNGKLASLSPRTQGLVPTSCKGGIKSERSLLSSRDGTEKPIHVEWRR